MEHKITKEGDELVIRIPFYQKEFNCYKDDKDLGVVDNLIGVIAGDDYTISQLIDLSYKGDQQEGGAIYHYRGEKENFRKLCDKLGIPCIEHTVCHLCGGVIYGSSAVDSGGCICFDCDKKAEEKEKLIL